MPDNLTPDPTAEHEPRRSATTAPPARLGSGRLRPPGGGATEAVTADGDRPAGRWRLTLGNAAGRVFEARNVPGGAPGSGGEAARYRLAVELVGASSVARSDPWPGSEGSYRNLSVN